MGGVMATGTLSDESVESTWPIEEWVKSILVDKLGCKREELATETLLVEDLGMDSAESLEIKLDLEEDFDLPRIPDGVAEGLKTFGQMVAYVKSALAAQA